MDLEKTVETYRRGLLDYSDQEISTLLQVLAETNWLEFREQEQERKDGTCPGCYKYVGKENIGLNPRLPKGYQRGCSRCLRFAPKHYKYVCAMCDGFYNEYRSWSGHIPMCSDCYQEYKWLWQMYRKHILLAQNQALPATLTLRELVEALTYFEWKCAYCGGTFETIDHVFPRVLGGGTTPRNALPSCHQCNGHKGKKLLEELVLSSKVRARIQHYIDALPKERELTNTKLRLYRDGERRDMPKQS